MQSELRRSAHKIRVLEQVTSSWAIPSIQEQLDQAVSACAKPCSNSKLTLLVLQELAAVSAEHKGLMFAYNNVETTSCNIEHHLRQVSNLPGSQFQQYMHTASYDAVIAAHALCSY